MWTVYVLQSESSGRFYVGHTDDLARRVPEHNNGQTKSTRNRGPWNIFHTETFDSKSQAYARERQIKSWKSRRSILQLVERR
ncbi:MAG TPA: GIY-YIG nuclease family protein [Fimbriimonadaceae bacterium]|nr:GIY-YIG nuclease family protein [Fimbriimonadaceae bacterium]HRJ95355.1 GIY-YIG nuclease family protein [Fimbriimonadaceae bacterium]